MPMWHDIPAGEIDPGSPVTTGLMTKERDNPYATRKFARRSTDSDPITNSTTVVNDTELFIQVVGGQTWEFEAFLIVTSTVAADFRCQVVTPDTVNDVGYAHCSQQTYEVDTFEDRDVINQPMLLTNWLGATTLTYFISGYVILDSTPAVGYLRIAWAQGSLHATDQVILKEHSYLRGLRVDET